MGVYQLDSLVAINVWIWATDQDSYGVLHRHLWWNLCGPRTIASKACKTMLLRGWRLELR